MAKRKPKLTRIERRLQSDGALCVTFVNTQRRQPLKSYDGLLAWGIETETLTGSEARRLADIAREHPSQADGVIRQASTLRDRLERILLALTTGNKPSAADLRKVNATLRTAMAARELDPAGRTWIWGATEGEDLDRMLWPVLLSAADLLTSADRGQVRRCSNEECGLLFVARSSGRPRKWCSAKCRSRGSTNRFYRRTIAPKKKRWAKERQHEQSARLAAFGASLVSRAKKN